MGEMREAYKIFVKSGGRPLGRRLRRWG